MLVLPSPVKTEIMAKLIRRLSRLSAKDLLLRILFIEARLQGNAAFATLSALLLEVAEKRQALEEAITAAAD